MEDFSCGTGPKRAPPPLLFDYFMSLGDMARFVLEQQSVVRQHHEDWLDLSEERKEELLDGAFLEPDIVTVDYPKDQWGRGIVSAKRDMNNIGRINGKCTCAWEVHLSYQNAHSNILSTAFSPRECFLLLE